MPSRKQKARHFLAMWDMQGLECIFDITKLKEERDNWEKKKIWQVLKEEQLHDIEPTIPLNLMILRARVNAQRHYEIYEFNSYLSKEELEEVFDSDPQPLVEWIRENGYKVYSNYVQRKKCLIV